MANKAVTEDHSMNSKLPCSFCDKTGKTNSICCRCKKAFCIVHSSYLNSENASRICDDCLEIHLMSDLPDSETTIEAISEEIQKIINEREENTQHLCKISANFVHRKSELDAEVQALKGNELDLVGSIKDTKEQLKTIEELNNKLAKETEKNKQELEIAKTKNSQNLKEIEGVSEKLKEVTKERNAINSELNELKDFIKLQVPIRLVKRIVCSSCFSRVLNQYHNVFQNPSSASSAEIRRSSITQPAKKTGACNSCTVF